jgi:2-C-methyl-D-erythritol 4-phosphate cytidylyltransferase
MNTLAILVAAGRGERMGADRPKAFVTLAGASLLLRAARAFEASPEVDGVLAVVPAGYEEMARGELGELKKLSAVVPGGARRQDSVSAGLDRAGTSFEGVVLVHDAARPLVCGETIAAVAAAAREHGAALPVLEMVDTVKRVRDGRVVETLDRSALGAAQTPQGFRATLLREAYRHAEREGLALTDEAMAVEALGHPVIAVPGLASNRKLTTLEDLEWAEYHLRREAARA